MYKIKQLSEDFIVEEITNAAMEESGEYSYFLLEKKDFDTEKAIQKIAEHNRLPRKFFSYAGNKDRHAITRQMISVKGKIKEQGFGDFKITLAGYGSSPVFLGQLVGNRFTIVVRNIKKKPVPVTQIINYFDEQRFGRHNLEIGLAILKKDFKSAAGLIDHPDAIGHLKKKNNDFITAIKKVPFKTVTLYMHAVQSFLWNEAASAYIMQKTKKIEKSDYKHGEFVFPKSKIDNIMIPLVSFDTEFADEKVKKIYDNILEKNKICLRDFVIRQIPDITPIGGTREFIADVMGLEISELSADELNDGMKKVTLNFGLGKGSYATIAVRRLFL